MLSREVGVHGQWPLLLRPGQALRTLQLHRQGLEVLWLSLQYVHIQYVTWNPSFLETST